MSLRATLPPSPPRSDSGQELSTIDQATPVYAPDTPVRSPIFPSSFCALSSFDPATQVIGDLQDSPGLSQTDVERSDTEHGGNGEERRSAAHLDDFQLIRVLGKGCAGRVRHLLDRHILAPH